MATIKHGITTGTVATSVSTPKTAASGVAVVVGTAPVHMVGGQANRPVICTSNGEATAKLGYSDDWEKYTLCEAAYTQFALFGVSPVVFINVLDPTRHKKTVEAAPVDIIDRKAVLPLEAIKATVKATGEASAALVENEDYTLTYADGGLVLAVVAGGKLDGKATVNVGYDAVDPSQVKEADIIGGMDVNSKKRTGLEAIEDIFPACSTVPDIIIAPGWSHKPAVAAVMEAKTTINGVFKARAIADIDTATATDYAKAVEAKNAAGTNSDKLLMCWPMCKVGDHAFHLSTITAALMAQVDNNAENGGTPCESPSNKACKAEALVLADGTEIMMDVPQANIVNSAGIITAVNFINGFVLWGNYTTAFPASADVKDYFIPVARMFDFVANTMTLTFWGKVDNKMNRRLIDSIIDAANIWLNGMVAAERMLGARIEFIDEENPLTELLAGHIKYHIYIAPPVPAQEIEFVEEYDATYLSAALTA